MRRLTVYTAIAACVALMQPACAEPLPFNGGFSLPVKCSPGKDCWIINYVDVAAGPAARDFTCGPRTYDGHKGVDFAIRDLVAMQAGVAVIAIADGTVLRRRDGVPDTGPDEAAGRRECGNGVVISHDGGWTSQYCHLRRGSVTVKPGQPVARGARLGLVGLSGRTEFPHAHLTLRRRGTVVDPFTGQAIDAGCGKRDSALWHADATRGYDAGGLYAAGFATGKVSTQQILMDARTPSALPPSAPALVLWGAAFGLRKDDVLHLVITGPGGGVVIDHRARIPRNRARHIAFAGARRPETGWKAGSYRGMARHLRGGRLLNTRQVTVTLR
ncbi:MAG: M23 family metallopeptidase [Alphaproteobacteria bacterium]